MTKSYFQLKEHILSEQKLNHHYTAGADTSPDEKGHYDKEDTHWMGKMGNDAKKGGGKVSYSSTLTANDAGVKPKGMTYGHRRSSTFNPKLHDTIHISHHDENHMRKVLHKHNLIASHDDHEGVDLVKAKKHGDHSPMTAEYHHLG